MKKAREFRKGAFEALRGKWGLAVIAAVLASICGVSTATDFSFNFDVSSIANEEHADGIDVTVKNFFESINSETIVSVLIACSIALLVSIPLIAIYFVLGSTVTLGYSKFNLAIIDVREAKIGNLFEYFKIWKSAAIMQLLRFVYIFLWSLLFIIPGVVASYSYSMTPYIMAEFPEISPKEALRASQKLMYGNRYRLFCLDVSFIGWHILAILSFGIGYLWLTPYINAAKADFYREISGTRPSVDIPLDDFFVNPDGENSEEF